jgi:hypothetical protein
MRENTLGARFDAAAWLYSPLSGSAFFSMTRRPR